LLDKARQCAGEYIASDPFLVLDQLQEIGAPAFVTQTGGRYFGFVNGGALPVGLAARWTLR